MTKILIRNSDNVVIYAEDNLKLNPAQLLGNKWRDPNFTTKNSTLVDADLPEFWRSGKWAYINRTWTVIDPVEQAAYAASLATDTKTEKNVPILLEIKRLEAEHMLTRSPRECILSAMEGTYNAGQLAQRPQYTVVKEYDNRIAALRSQLV